MLLLPSSMWLALLICCQRFSGVGGYEIQAWFLRCCINHLNRNFNRNAWWLNYSAGEMKRLKNWVMIQAHFVISDCFSIYSSKVIELLICFLVIHFVKSAIVFSWLSKNCEFMIMRSGFHTITQSTTNRRSSRPKTTWLSNMTWFWKWWCKHLWKENNAKCLPRELVGDKLLSSQPPIIHPH